MAINTDSAETPWGDRKNRKQCIMLLPAKAEANKPAVINLQSVDAGTVTDRYLFINDAGDSLMLHTAVPDDSANDGTALGGVATLDAAFDATASPGKGIIDGAVATGAGNCLRVGGTGTDKIEFWHDGSNAHIHALADDLYLSSVGGDINFSGDNIANAGSITGTSASLGDGELTAGSINRGSGTLTLEINGTAEVSITATATTLGGHLDVNTTGEVTCGSINRATGNLTFEIGDTPVLTVASGAITAAQGITLGTGELTAGSINRAAGSLTLEIAGVAEQTITDSETTFNGNIILPSGGTITSAGTYISFGTEELRTTSNIIIGIDGTSSVGRLGFGVAGISDAYIEFDGSTMKLWDTTTGPWTLAELATGTTLDPTIDGNLVIGDGNFTWTNEANNESAVWTLKATDSDGIQVVSSNTSADVIQVTANATIAGNLLYLVAANATMTSGAYIKAHDGTNQAFAFRRYGALTIAGNAAVTPALTLTKGDLDISEGFIDSDSPIGTGGHNFTTADTGSSSTPFMTLHNSAAAFDQTLLLLDYDANGAFDAMQITHDSTGYGLSIVGTAVTGGQLFIDGPASQTERMVDVVGTWIGKGDEGMIDVTDASALIAGASLLRLDSSGSNAGASFVVEIICSGAVQGATLGTCLNITDTGSSAAAGTSYAQYISSTANNGLNIVTGAIDTSNLVMTGVASQTSSMMVLDGGTGAGWEGAADVGMLHVKAVGVRADPASSLVLISDITGASPAAGRGTSLAIVDTTTVGADSFVAYISTDDNDGLKIDTGDVAGINLELQGVDAQAAPMLFLDGTTTDGWDGATGVGMVQLTAKGAHGHANASLLNIVESSGATITSARGTCLRIIDTTTAGSDAWIAYMNTTANDGLWIVTGEATDINLKLTGVASQTSSMMILDGQTGAGWDGNSATGQLHIINDGVQVDVGASALYIDIAGEPIAAAEGAGIHVIQSIGSGITDAFLVNIEAKSGGGGLHVDGGYSVFDEDVTVIGGYLTSPTTVTTDSTDGAITYTAAQVLGGIIIRDTLTGDKTDIFCEADDLVAAIPGCAVGTSFDFYILVSDVTNGIILDGGTNITHAPADPHLIIPAKNTGHFRAVCTNITGASEAFTVYLLGYGPSIA